MARRGGGCRAPRAFKAKVVHIVLLYKHDVYSSTLHIFLLQACFIIVIAGAVVEAEPVVIAVAVFTISQATFTFHFIWRPHAFNSALSRVLLGWAVK